ncbi:MAG: hypothetical protein WBG73_21340 [Coleofasciculaceae cyanobacterium]
MNKQNNSKLSIPTLLSIVGVAGASVLMSFPAFAQMAPSNSGSSTETPQMTGDRKPTDDRFMQQQTPASSQQMNTMPAETPGMTGDRKPTDDRFMQQTQDSQQMDTGTSNTTERQINTGTTTVETQQNRSTTSQQVNPDGTMPMNTPAVAPTDTAPMSTPEDTMTPSTGATQQAPDQGVRALW